MTTFDHIQVTGKKDTRSGFGDGILEAARANPNIVALTADLAGSMKLDGLIKELPKQFVQVGIAEANMIGIAAGLAIAGKIPFTTTFANFSTGRVYDQIRQSVAYSHKNVKICASHAGVTLGEDGATHQILEDLGMMRMLPGMTVINPCDYAQTKAATLAIAKHHGPVYLRFGRPVWPIFTEGMPFEIGKALPMTKGSDVTILATGHLVWNSLEAAKQLASEGISCEVINIHTIKPLDEKAIYVVANSDYIANGGDGCDMLRNIPKLDKGYLLRDAMIDYISEFTQKGQPLDPKIENRVTNASN